MSTETTTALKSKRTRQAVVLSNKMDKTAVVEVTRRVRHPKYKNLPGVLIAPRPLGISYSLRHTWASSSPLDHRAGHAAALPSVVHVLPGDLWLLYEEAAREAGVHHEFELHQPRLENGVRRGH